MAKIYPNSDKVRVIFASHAEEQVYQLLKRLKSDWTVYYSCTLSGFEHEQGLTDNEIDFVLYHPKWGLMILEVKGGRIIYNPDEQQFYSENRFGERFSIKNPFAQALNWKSRFLRYLKKKNIKVPMTHMVCFPSIYEKDFPERADFETGLLLGRERLERLDEALPDAIRLAQPEKYLQFRDVGDALDKILRGTHYASRLYIRDYIDQHENKVRDVEHIQDNLISPMAGTKRLAVEGEAGTGKTMLAIALARHFRDAGKEVLLLSSNPLLNNYMKEQVGTRVKVLTYSEAAAAYGVDILKRPHEFQGSREDWIQYVGPERLKAATLASPIRYDVLLCDEAQDVQPFWWESIEACLRNEQSHFYIFFDRSQGVFGSGAAENSFVPEDVLPIAAPYFPLVHNYRTTKEIAAFARAFRTGRQILVSHSGRLGYIPEIVSYKDIEEAQKKLQDLLQRLIEEEGLKAQELTILSARRPFQPESVLHGVKITGSFQLEELQSLKTQEAPRDGTISVATISSFKGLETSVAIVTNLSEYHMPLTNPIMASLLYVACTRAKHMLFIMVQKDDPKKELLEKALDGIVRKGTLVVGEQAFDHVYAGTVNYYNPERLGWITVDDPSLQRNSIMFFPSDVVKAELLGLQVGSRLSFRLKVEGFAAVAVDLKQLS